MMLAYSTLVCSMLALSEYVSYGMLAYINICEHTICSYIVCSLSEYIFHVTESTTDTEVGTVLNLGPTSSQKCEAVPRRARIFERPCRGGLVFKAHRLLHHSTLGLRVIKKKKKKVSETPSSTRTLF